MLEKIPVAESPTGALVDRGVALIVSVTGAVLVWLLANIHPDQRGHGTHEQLGMTPCGWPPTLDLPCPTCGVTTAACHLVHLSPLRAVLTQPFGAALAGAGIVLAVYAVFCLLTGRSLMDRLVRLPYGSILVWTLVLFLASWLFKYLTFAT